MFLNFSFANEKITLQLSWFGQFQFAGYYMAKEKGFYKEEGLDVDIRPFDFSIDIPSGVNSGKFDFAIGRETLILEKTKNKNIVSLYALFQATPLVLLTTKDSKINEIKDFKNKKIMTTIDDASEVSIKSMLISQNLNIKNLNFIKHTHNINDLIDKKTDVISAYTSKSPYHLQKKGIEYNIFAPKDYGFDMYSDFLYTSALKIKKDKELVLSFKEASLKGWEYAYNNIEETVDLILKKYNTQNLTKEELIFEAKELKKLSYYKNNNLGDIDLNKLQRIYDLYNVMGLIEHKIDIKDFVYSKNTIFSYIKNEFKKLSQYKGLPYLYLFMGLFCFLVLLIVFEHLKLRKMALNLISSKEELLKVNKELKESSEKDHLTKLYNRRYFESISKEYLALAKREKQDISIIMIDIDDFKKVNDTYGHQAGDFVLSSMAKTMLKSKRDSDVVARYGGEEFIVLLPNTSLNGAKFYSENLRKEIENHKINIEQKTLNITVSIGLTVCNSSDTIDKAIDRADEALYFSKGNGKNQINVK